MTQTRIWNYGDTFTSFRGSTALGVLHNPGVFSGYDVSVTDTDKFELSTGYLLLSSGIMVGESVPLEFLLNPLPAAATTYTLTVRHTDSDIIGGQAAIYALEVGELLPSAILDGIPILYLYYPGGAVALDISHFVPVRKRLEAAIDASALVPSSFVAPMARHWVASTLDVNTTIVDGYVAPSVFTSVVVDGLGSLVPPSYSTSSVALQLVAGRLRPVSVSIRARIATANPSIVLKMLDTDGFDVSLDGSITGYTVSGTVPVFSTFTVSVDRASGVFTEGDLYTLLLDFHVPQSESLDLQSITVSYDPLP